MKHRIPIIALSLLMTSCLPAEPTTRPATKPGGNRSNPRILRHEDKIVLSWNATDDDLLRLGNGKGIVALHYGGWPLGGPSPRITDKGLANLGGWKSLKELVFIPATTDSKGREIPHITDEGLKHLAGLKTLEKLVLCDQKITDAGLAHLSGLVNMKELHLDFIPLTGAGLKHLRGMKHLKVLRFYNAKITDADLENLKGMTDMENLQLGRARITDKGLAIIARMKKLHTLDLQGNPITDKGLANLAVLSELKWLALKDTNITDAGLEHLKNLNKLEWLILDGAKIADAGLRHLKGLSKLRVLYLSKTRIGDAGLESLSALPSLERLKLNQTAVTDEGLLMLKDMKSLTELDIRRTSVTQAGIKKMKLTLPDIEIVMDKPSAHATKPTSRPTTTTATSAPAVDPKVMAILKRLEVAGEKHPNITADIDFKVDMLQTGDTEGRTGKVYYQGPTEKTPPKFRIHFDTLRQGDGPKIKDVVDYAFDGEWFTVRKERIKQMSRYQVARPGEKVNPLQLGKGPFPVPFGQKADTVIKHFKPITRPVAKTDPKDTDYIKLTTRKQYRKDFSVVWLEMWVDRTSGLPVKIVTEDRSENQTTVIFKDTKTPKSFDKKIFSLPRPPAGWEYHVEKFKGRVE